MKVPYLERRYASWDMTDIYTREKKNRYVKYWILFILKQTKNDPDPRQNKHISGSVSPDPYQNATDPQHGSKLKTEFAYAKENTYRSFD